MIVSRAKDNKLTTEITVSDCPTVRPIYCGQPIENGGIGTDFRPSQLLLAGLISCMSVNVRAHMDQDNIPYEDVIISADMEHTEDGITKISTKIEIISDISDEEKQKYIDIANNCYVKRLLASEKQFLTME